MESSNSWPAWKATWICAEFGVSELVSSILKQVIFGYRKLLPATLIVFGFRLKIGHSIIPAGL
ncbi:unnamed protein product, partial [Sphenostylis stenocarpa]